MEFTILNKPLKMETEKDIELKNYQKLVVKDNLKVHFDKIGNMLMSLSLYANEALNHSDINNFKISDDLKFKKSMEQAKIFKKKILKDLIKLLTKFENDYTELLESKLNHKL
jgi:hypothetical protein